VDARAVLRSAATRTRAVTIAEIALATFAAHNLPDGVEPSIGRRGHL